MNRPDRIRELVLAPAEVPAGVAEFLHRIGGPAWIEVAGQDRSRWRMVVTLLHGNEPSGVRALHAWLKSGDVPAVNMAAYVGSVEAALAGDGFRHRALPGERDANRVYGDDVDDRQGRLARDFTRRFRARSWEALVDLHNNTGHNPAYGVGFGVDNARLNLTDLFGDWYMNSDLRLNTLVEMAAACCPAIAVECGRAGDAGADAVALSGLKRFTGLERLALQEPAPRHLRILERPVRVRLAAGAEVAFADGVDAGADLTLRADIDRHNFECLPAGAGIGWLRDAGSWPLEALGAQGVECSRELFAVRDGQLVTRRSLVPVMMTTDAGIARADCLFYAMNAPLS